MDEDYDFYAVSNLISNYKKQL